MLNLLKLVIKLNLPDIKKKIWKWKKENIRPIFTDIGRKEE